MYFFGCLFRSAIGVLILITHLSAQTRDSLPKVSRDAPEKSGVTAMHWQTLVQQLSAQVDSVKARLSWDPPLTDTVYLDSALHFFHTKKDAIQALAETLKDVQEKMKAVPESHGGVDSSVVLDILVQDSIRLHFSSVQDTLNRIQDNLSRLHEEVVRLELITREHRKEVRTRLTPPVERGFSPRRTVITLRKNLIKDGSTVSFFDYPAWSSRIFIILLSLLYCYWIYRLGRITPNAPDDLLLHKNEPLWVPLLKSCIFFLILLPFASFSIPVLVLEGAYLVIFIFFFLILFRELSPFKRKILSLIFLYLILLIGSNLVLSEALWSRIVSVVINFIGLFLVWTMGRRTDMENPVGFINRYTRWIIIFSNVMAIVWSGVGYVAIGRTWALAAGIGLLLALSLRAFRDMLLHDVEKQYKRLEADSIFRRFDLKRVSNSFNRLIKVCCGLLVLIVLLNIFDLTREARNVVDRLFAAQHKLGNVTFSYGNLFLAIAIIWLANWIQKTLKNLLGDMPNRDESFKVTSFPLFRLAIIIIGFLIAISVLGMGMDKLTVIIGALSVGIGLGLQNII
ncbi:MAG TPA: hypothetical protein PKA53_11125, partial [Sphingobacterium sp.]|nr:hypothetical protein [Sphingobacterium sp.]